MDDAVCFKNIFVCLSDCFFLADTLNSELIKKNTAPNYGCTLFPAFISEAETYSEQISNYLITQNTKQRSLYYNILIYKILAEMMSCSVSLNEKAKKAPFFCKNSIERKGKLKQILQRYAFDHQYIKGFPSCYEEAIDYFEEKSNLYLSQYKAHYVENGSTRIIKSESKVIMEPSQMVVKSEPVDNPKEDESFWKAKVIELREELERERRRKMDVIKERDELKAIIQRQNEFMHNAQRYALSQQKNATYGVIATPPRQFNHGDITMIDRSNLMRQSHQNNNNHHQQILGIPHLFYPQPVPQNSNGLHGHMHQNVDIVERLKKVSNQSPENMVAVLTQYLSTNQ